MSYEPVPIETNAEAQQQYLAGACDVYTTDASGLAATRATENPGAHVVLPQNHFKRASRSTCAWRQQLGYRTLDAERFDHR